MFALESVAAKLVPKKTKPVPIVNSAGLRKPLRPQAYVLAYLHDSSKIVQ
jgi:hypothetical protein